MPTVRNHITLTSQSPNPPDQLVSPVTSIRALVVEDDELDAQIVQRALRNTEQVAYHVEHVRNLSNAYKRIFNSSFDVVLLDLGLPDGFELNGLSRLVSLLEVPVIVLTGNEGSEIAVEALACGAHDFVAKSENLSVILPRVISYTIQRHRTQAELARTEQLLSVQGEFAKLQSANIQQRLDSASLLATFASDSKQCIALIQSEGVIEWANDSFEARYSANPGELNHRSLDQILTDLQGRQWHEELQIAMDASESFELVWRSENGSGDELWNRIELVPTQQPSTTNQRFLFSLTVDVIPR
ncbi:response regulator [Fuerstiella marisgermanici]|uniref:Swarming motility regulation protein RssB n=1 Tax=Fuerstiella marisgermanici TaxID=1891926 RepID=A0A1P8WAA2_9PLAN|nr:response regulator [Fuerstiella marisgermanici]APZ90986.1 Swarming motility regulation protein RssB [Fuerstiella marisgermanici]